VRQSWRVTGEEWLRHALDPALRTSRPPYEDLRTELRALTEADALSEDEASSAHARLDQDEQDRSTIVRRRTEQAFAEPRGDAVAQDSLREVLTPERPLGEINDVTVVLMRVELWTSRLIVRLEALQSALTDALDASFGAEWQAWETGWIERRAEMEAEGENLRWPQQPSVSRLGRLPLSVADDLGTRFHAIGTATGGSGHPWRSEWRLEPGVPTAASVLRIGLEDGAPARESVELALLSQS
jgi:hypothetical protein